jgi:hypothetical protein
MTQRRGTATNQLSTVIDALQLGKQTGFLTIERGESETFEEGTITFVHGQVVQGVIGSYRGRDAVTKLLSWQACRFFFVPMEHEQISQPANSRPGVQADPDQSPLNTYRALPGNQQIEPTDGMDRRPLVILYYQNSMDSILRSLEHQGFSRTHRRLFLLINGRRRIKELAFLIQRTLDETVILLEEMEQAGIIRL